VKDDDDLPPLPDLGSDDTPLTNLVGPAIDAMPGLARIGASAWLHSAEWGARTTARTGLRLFRSLGDPEEAAALLRDASEVAGAVTGVVRAVSSGVPLSRALSMIGDSMTPSLSAEPSTTSADEQLRRRGAELLERSRDVWDGSAAHPAFARILGELAPDEARMLLLLLQKGPQPSVDVRTGGPLGFVSSELLARNLTMIGPQAGVRYIDQVPAYINNLFRLGLIWFSPNPLRDPLEYQVLEAQPDVLDILHGARFSRPVRRSVHLTPFGDDFCRRCLVDEAVSVEEFPEHAAPEGDSGSD